MPKYVLRDLMIVGAMLLLAVAVILGVAIYQITHNPPVIPATVQDR